MRKTLFTTMLGAALFSSFLLSAQAEVTSLRGANNLDADANPITKPDQIKKEGGFERSWDLQPPSIPHTIDKDRISLAENTCMKCHSKENAEKEKSPPLGDSHYVARDGTTLDKPSARRYFCSQCHTPQADLPPLVENTF